MTSVEWEAAPEVAEVEATRDTEPAPPPTLPENDEPPPLRAAICELCDGYGEHDAACPLCPAVSP